MPEAPDVQVYKRYLDATALHHEVTHVETRDERILDKVTRQKLVRSLVGRSLTQTSRRGKHLFVRVGETEWLHIHFGMTGYVRYFKNESKEPAHSRVLLTFANGFHLAFVSQRLLGTVGLVDDPRTFIKEKDLGPDIFAVSREEFVPLLQGRRGYVKSALMKQRLVAGLGNVYSDEVLFQARLLPSRHTADLHESELDRLWNTTQDVLRAAVEAHADVERMPKDWLLPHRSEGERCPVCGGRIATKKLAGRRSYFCPSCQK